MLKPPLQVKLHCWGEEKGVEFASDLHLSFEQTTGNIFMKFAGINV